MLYLLDGYETERLLFRKIKPSDFNTWLPFHEEPLSSQFWEGLPKNPKIACQQQFNRIFERYEKGLGGMNALILKNKNSLVGLCGLLVQEVDGKEELEIGYSILPQYWKMGLATEAAIKCREVAFKEEWASSLISIIHVDNIPSQKVALNNGMMLDKTTVYNDNPVHIFRTHTP
ncbi:GNAT family N-acetyltransferase [Maribacter sp. 2210JD10-5]|uniref:GNAT family N-acetyltransferase n=1 Tax=Maribacter sp. 2210JD10-5 TaxID=3386272 RepID=UPI0039BCD535